jgi:hypothetical protein
MGREISLVLRRDLACYRWGRVTNCWRAQNYEQKGGPRMVEKSVGFFFLGDVDIVL